MWRLLALLQQKVPHAPICSLQFIFCQPPNDCWRFARNYNSKTISYIIRLPRNINQLITMNWEQWKRYWDQNYILWPTINQHWRGHWNNNLCSQGQLQGASVFILAGQTTSQWSLQETLPHSTTDAGPKRPIAHTHHLQSFFLYKLIFPAHGKSSKIEA